MTLCDDDLIYELVFRNWCGDADIALIVKDFRVYEVADDLFVKMRERWPRAKIQLKKDKLTATITSGGNILWVRHVGDKTLEINCDLVITYHSKFDTGGSSRV